MVAALDNAIKSVFFEIPVELLELAFEPQRWQVTIDQRIKDVVIDAMVLSDCNLYGGKYKRIPLSNAYLEQTRPDPTYTGGSIITGSGIYRIPPAARENRDIVSVIDLTYPYEYTAYSDAPFGFGNIGNTVGQLASRALSSRTHSNSGITPTPILRSGNMIEITPPNIYINDWILVCRLGFDDEFVNLDQSMIKPLSEMILNATKAYIYVNMIIKIDKVFLSGGQELGIIKSLVESYSDAKDKYKEAVTEFRGSAAFDKDVVQYMILNSL